MKKNLTKKALVPALAMALASIVALSGVTYAWFTTGNTATVSGLDVNVQTANGIQVSLDAASWKSNLNGEDIIKAIEEAKIYGNRKIQFPTGEVLPVSSAGNVDANGLMEIFDGGIAESGNLYSTKATDGNGTTGNYIAFDLFIKSSMDQEMGLNADSKVICTALTGDAFDNVGTHTAVRVAFLALGSDTDANVARGLKGDGSDAIIWEPNATERAPGSEGEAGVKIPYNGFNSEFNLPEADITSEVEAVTTVTDINEIKFQLKNGINKIRVYIWLEGQDVDCINNISFGDFAVNLGFYVEEA